MRLRMDGKPPTKGATRNVVLTLFGQVKKNYFFIIFIIYILAKNTRVLKVLQSIFWGKIGPSYDIMKSHIQTSHHFMHEELQIFLSPIKFGGHVMGIANPPTPSQWHSDKYNKV
jgi:hypothetical protein